MKIFLLTSLLVASLAIGASAEVRVTVTPIGERSKTAQSAHNDFRKSYSVAEILVNQDFSAFVEGTESEPDLSNPLAMNGSVIDPILTNGKEWIGNNVYSAGGTVALNTPTPYNPAFLCTPQNDYSGHIKLTFDVKYDKCEYVIEEGVTGVWTGSTCYVRLYSPKGEPFVLGENQSGQLANFRIYKNQGWYEVEVDFDNYTAYNDASIMFTTYEGMLIDNVRITAGNEDFLASPTHPEIFDVTQTSFSVRFEPVRKAFNYYLYLYTITGYDEGGEPIYYPVCPPKLRDELEEDGLTWEDYIDYMGGGDPFAPDVNYGSVKEFEPTVFTYEGLDPAVDYYYAIRSHYVRQFSPLEIKPVNVIAAPVIADPTDITNNGFTANWDSVVKADNYELTLYGVSEAEADEERYIVFDESFSNLSSFSDSNNIFDPTIINGAESGITIDDLTTVPGWSIDTDDFTITDNALGLVYAELTTPEIYVANSDQIIFSIKAKATTETGTFTLGFAGVYYQITFESSDVEGEIILPTNGMKQSRLIIMSDWDSDIFIENIEVYQSIKKGDTIYYFLNKEDMSKGSTSCIFSELTDYNYDKFAYGVVASRGEGLSMISSVESDRMIVDLVNGTYTNNIEDIESPAEIFEVARYTIDGKRISSPRKGINIIRYSDGSIRKEMVK